MSDEVKNLTLETLRKRTSRPTVNRAIDSLATPTTPVAVNTPTTPTTPATPATPTTPATPADNVPALQPVKQVRRTLRVDSDANALIKSMLGLGEGEISIDVLVEALLMFVSEEPESVTERVIAIAKSRAAQRRARSLKLREKNRKNKSV